VPSSIEAAQELQREQDHVDRSYARLHVLKERARRMHADANVIGSFGSTPQARLARDIFADVRARRIADLEFGQLPLVFGRTDDVDGETFHIGRVSVLDEGSNPLVVDWRAPAAEPFYRATPTDPLGLVRRRYLYRGRRGPTKAGGGIAKNVDVKVVADRLHHTTTRITQDFYQHPSEDILRAAAETQAAALRSAMHAISEAESSAESSDANRRAG
jgi:hypothetical protein